MRLAIVVAEFPGGPFVWTLVRARNLARAGVDVRLFFYQRGGSADLAQILGKEVEPVALPKNRSIFVELLQLAWSSLRPGRLRTAWSYYRAAVRQGLAVRSLLGLLWQVHPLAYWKPDIVHIDTSYLAFGLLEALEPLARSVVISLRGADVDEKPIVSARWRRLYLDAKDKPWLQFHCVSQHVLRRATELGVPVSRCHVIYQGVEQPSAPLVPANATGLDLLLVVARLVPAKGVDLAVRALAILRQRGFDVCMEVVGSGPQRPVLEALASRMGVADRVKYLGLRDHAWVQEHLKRNQGRAIVVQPSRREAFGQSVLEAMSLELPVVAARVGGIPELIRHEASGLLHDPEGSEDLADKIQRLLRDPDLARTLGVRARARAAEFSTERETEDFLRLLSSLE